MKLKNSKLLLKKLAQQLNWHNLKVNLTTNGVLFPKYAEELSKCENLSKINFSLHSENNIPNYCEKIFDSVNKLNNQTVIIH